MSKLFLMKFDFIHLIREETDFRKYYKTILIFALLILLNDLIGSEFHDVLFR